MRCSMRHTTSFTVVCARMLPSPPRRRRPPRRPSIPSRGWNPGSSAASKTRHRASLSPAPTVVPNVPSSSPHRLLQLMASRRRSRARASHDRRCSCTLRRAQCPDPSPNATHAARRRARAIAWLCGRRRDVRRVGAAASRSSAASPRARIARPRRAVCVCQRSNVMERRSSEEVVAANDAPSPPTSRSMRSSVLVAVAADGDEDVVHEDRRRRIRKRRRSGASTRFEANGAQPPRSAATRSPARRSRRGRKRVAPSCRASRGLWRFSDSGRWRARARTSACDGATRRGR